MRAVPVHVMASRVAALSAKQLLTDWDKSPNFKIVRRRILEMLVAGDIEIDTHLRDTGELVLSRIVSWMRLTYSFSDVVALQLNAIGVFLSSSGAAHYLKAFAKCGGIASCVDVVGAASHTIKAADRLAAFRLLLTVADAGRAYKLFVCQAQGASHEFVSI